MHRDFEVYLLDLKIRLRAFGAAKSGQEVMCSSCLWNLSVFCSSFFSNIYTLTFQVFVTDYINYRLSLESVEWPQRPILCLQTAWDFQLMRDVIHAFEKMHSAELKNMVCQLFYNKSFSWQHYTEVIPFPYLSVTSILFSCLSIYTRSFA